MELTYLHSRYQVSLRQAVIAATPEARYAHRGLAQCYADKIRVLERATGSAAMLGDN